MLKCIAVLALAIDVAAPPTAPAASAEAAAGGPSRSASAVDPRAIQLTDAEPARVASIEHVGPYWAMGPAIAQVREAMNARGEPGPLIVRYLDNPLTTPPQRLRSKVGFIIRGSGEPAEPFAISEWPPELVVEMSVTGPYRYSTRYYRDLRSWALQRGLMPVGPVVELLRFAVDEVSDQPVRIDIRMPVCEPEPAPPPGENGDSAQAEPSESPVSDKPLATASLEPQSALSASVPAPTGNGAGLADDRDDGAPARSVPEPLHEADMKRQVARVSHSVRIRELIDAGRYAALAEQMLPDNRAMSGTNHAWLQQLVLRVSAVARGVQKQYPEQSGWLLPLSEALTRRSENLSSAAAQSRAPVERLVKRVSPEGDSGMERRKAVIRRLELLMGRVAVRSVEPAGVMDELAAILQEAQDLLDVAQQ